MLSFPRQINIYTEPSTKSIAFELHTYTRRYDTKANIACPAVHLKNFIAKHYGEVILHTSSKRNLIYKAKQFGQDQTMLFSPTFVEEELARSTCKCRYLRPTY